MTVAKAILTGVAAITIASSGALAQASLTGQIMKIDPQQGTIELQHRANGGADAPNVVDPFKIQAGLAVGNLKVGDRVTFSAAPVGGVWTVTAIKKQ